MVWLGRRAVTNLPSDSRLLATYGAPCCSVDRYQTFGTYLRIISIATSYQCTDSMNVMGRSYKLLQATLSMERTKSQESAVAAEAENAVHRRRWKELVQWGKAFIFMIYVCVK